MEITIEYKPDIEIQKLGYQILIKELGVLNFIRFIQSFEKGYGDYTKEKYSLHKDITIEKIVERIKRKGENNKL